MVAAAFALVIIIVVRRILVVVTTEITTASGDAHVPAHIHFYIARARIELCTARVLVVTELGRIQMRCLFGDCEGVGGGGGVRDNL